MHVRRWSAEGPVPAVKGEETVACPECDWETDAAWMNSEAARNFDGTHVTWDDPNHCSVCPNCGAMAKLECGQKADPVCRRLGRTRSWTPIWNAIVMHARAIGLSTDDVALLILLETYRRKATDDAHPKHATIAAALPFSERTARRRLDSLVGRGLIEKARDRRRADGTLGTASYTRRGLTRVMDHIAENDRQGREPTRGLPQLLADLAAPAASADLRSPMASGRGPAADHQRSSMPATSGQNGSGPTVRAVTSHGEEVGEEAPEEEGRDKRARPLSEREEDVVLAAVDAVVDGTLDDLPGQMLTPGPAWLYEAGGGWRWVPKWP